MVIPFSIRGMAFTNGQGIVACLPFPVNSHSHSHSLKIPWGWSILQARFSRQTEKQTERVVHWLRLAKWPKLGVTVVRGGVLVHHYFFLKKPLVLERLESLKNCIFFDTDCFSNLLAIPKKTLRSRAKFFRIPQLPSHSLKVLRKENGSFPDSHSLRM